MRYILLVAVILLSVSVAGGAPARAKMPDLENAYPATTAMAECNESYGVGAVGWDTEESADTPYYKYETYFLLDLKTEKLYDSPFLLIVILDFENLAFVEYLDYDLDGYVDEQVPSKDGKSQTPDLCEIAKRVYVTVQQKKV